MFRLDLCCGRELNSPIPPFVTCTFRARSIYMNWPRLSPPFCSNPKRKHANSSLSIFWEHLNTKT